MRGGLHVLDQVEIPENEDLFLEMIDKARVRNLKAYEDFCSSRGVRNAATAYNKQWDSQDVMLKKARAGQNKIFEKVELYLKLKFGIE